MDYIALFVLYVFNLSKTSGADFMTTSIYENLRYWRTSLADGALGEGKFTQADRKRFVDVPSEAVKSGVLPREAIERVFRGQASARTMGIRFWPLVMARKSSHGAARAGGLPELVAPVVTEATVDRKGVITPTRNAVARDLLTPLPSGEFSIGTVDALDSFLTENPLPDLMIEGQWQAYLVHCRKMVDAVSQGWPRGDADYQAIGSGFLSWPMTQMRPCGVLSTSMTSFWPRHPRSRC